MLQVPKATKAPKVQTVSIKDWLKGVNTAFDDGRTPSDGLRSGGNIMLDQDGTVRPRPSLAKYGPQPTGTILGQIYEFRDTSDPSSVENWMVSTQNVSGTTNIYIAKGSDNSWTVCTSGTTFDNSADAHFLQVQDKVLIMNGVDELSYLDIPTSAVINYTSLTDPSAVTVANNGSTDITTGTKPFTIYYAITANSSVGETAASTATSQDITTDRDFWDKTKNSLKISWTAVTDAKSYNLYCGIAADGAGTPTLYRIAAGISADSTEFIDDGSRAFQLINVAPTHNSTAGPKVTRGEVINGRPFLTGDTDKPYYVWYGGDPGFELDFSPANGGGFTPIGTGTKELPIAVKSFHQGKGDPGIFVLTQGTNGYGKRYVLSPDSITYGDQTITFYDVQEDNGTDGTDSPDAVITYNDDLWYPSRDGFKTTGTKPQLQNILSTDRVSDSIQPDISNLNTSKMGSCVGIAYQGRLYWALPYTSDSNNQIWVLDVDRKGAWTKPWNISADWMWLYNDNDGMTHFLVLSNNSIYEFTNQQFTNDDGVSFNTNLNSGQITFSDDGRTWGRLLNVIFVVLRPQGTMTASITGEGDGGAISKVGSEEFTPKTSVAGWDEPGLSWDTVNRAWDEITSVPLSVNSATQEIKVNVDEDLRWFSYALNTTGFGVNYNLSDIIAEYISIGIKDV